MTCEQLGGACSTHFHGETFKEIAEQAQSHGKEMMELGDEAHIEVMNKMRQMQNDPAAMEEWMESKKKEFESLPDHPAH